MSTIDPQNEKHADGIVEDRKQAPPAYFNILYYGLILWGIIFMGWYLFSGWSSHGEFEEKMAAHTGKPAVEAPAQSKTEMSSAPASVDASGLYADKCAGCHGAKGEGAFGPDLTASYKYGRDRAMVVESIAKGRPKNMPAFSSSLSAAEIDALTTYILDL